MKQYGARIVAFLTTLFFFGCKKGYFTGAGEYILERSAINPENNPNVESAVAMHGPLDIAVIVMLIIVIILGILILATLARTVRHRHAETKRHERIETPHAPSLASKESPSFALHGVPELVVRNDSGIVKNNETLSDAAISISYSANGNEYGLFVSFCDRTILNVFFPRVHPEQFLTIEPYKETNIIERYRCANGHTAERFLFFASGHRFNVETALIAVDTLMKSAHPLTDAITAPEGISVASFTAHTRAPQ